MTTTYHYRGQIERPYGSADGRCSYRWVEGWSRDSSDGKVEYPWSTKKEARAMDPGCKFKEQ